MASNQNDAIFSTAAISGLSVNQRLHFQSPLFVLCCSSFGLFPISSLSFVTNARMLIGLWCANTVLLQESISYWWVTCEKKNISLFCIILTQCTWRHQGMTRMNFVFPFVFKRNTMTNFILNFIQLLDASERVLKYLIITQIYDNIQIISF